MRFAAPGRNTIRGAAPRGAAGAVQTDCPRGAGRAVLTADVMHAEVPR
jgi:hypothetical protein